MDANAPRKLDPIHIIGGGLAGLVTANRAAQLGLKATVLEQGTAEKYLCNTRYTGGTFHLCLREITLQPDFLHQLILDTTDGFVKDDLARLLANGGAKIIAWLQAEGIKFMRASASEYHKWVLAPIGTGMLYVRKSKIEKIWPMMPAPESMNGNIRKFEEIGTSPAATKAAINEALALQDTKDKLLVQGIEAQGGTPAQFAAFLKSEIPKWTKVVRDSGAKPE